MSAKVTECVRAARPEIPLFLRGCPLRRSTNVTFSKIRGKRREKKNRTRRGFNYRINSGRHILRKRCKKIQEDETFSLVLLCLKSVEPHARKKRIYYCRINID